MSISLPILLTTALFGAPTTPVPPGGDDVEATPDPEPIVFCCAQVGKGWGTGCIDQTFTTHQDAKNTCDSDLAILACADDGHSKHGGTVHCSWEQDD